jgi:hypothetical protein
MCGRRLVSDRVVVKHGENRCCATHLERIRVKKASGAKLCREREREREGGGVADSIEQLKLPHW